MPVEKVVLAVVYAAEKIVVAVVDVAELAVLTATEYVGVDAGIGVVKELVGEEAGEDLSNVDEVDGLDMKIHMDGGMVVVLRVLSQVHLDS